MNNETPKVEETPAPETPPAAAVETPAEAAPESRPETEGKTPAAETRPVEKGQPEVTAAEPTPAPPKRGFFASLYAPDTRLGRINRAVLRWVATIVGLFALGLLAAYLLLYMPLKAEQDALKADRDQVQSRLETLQADLATAQVEKADLQALYEQSLADQERFEAQVNYLQVKQDLFTASVELKNRNGDKAMEALLQAETDLATLLPYVESIDPNLAELLQNRLKVVKNELVRDAVTAKSELDELYLRLLELEPDLFD